MESQEQIDAVFVDLFLELIDLFVVCDRGHAQFVVAFEQAADSAVERRTGFSLIGSEYDK